MPSAVAQLLAATTNKQPAQKPRQATLEDKASFSDQLNQAQSRQAQPTAAKEPGKKVTGKSKAHARKADQSKDEAPVDAPTEPADASTQSPPTDEAPLADESQSKPVDRTEKASEDKPVEAKADVDPSAAQAAMNNPLQPLAQQEPEQTPVEDSSVASLDAKQTQVKVQEVKSADADAVEPNPAPGDATDPLEPTGQQVAASQGEQKPVESKGEAKPAAPQVAEHAATKAPVIGAKDDEDHAQGDVPQHAKAHVPSVGSAKANTSSDEPLDLQNINPAEHLNKPQAQKTPQTVSPEVAVGPVAQNVDLPQEASAGDASEATSAISAIDSSPAIGHLQALMGHQSGQPTSIKDAASVQQPQQMVESRFVEDNHAKIVTSVHGQLLPKGGSMQIRLDPPELGAVWVNVQVRDGVMNASFQTSSEQATQLLSHSLSQLKTSLESNGMSVQRLQVEQAPRDLRQQAGDQQRQDGSQGNSQTQQEQQRREALRRMWRKLSGGDPLDLVA